MAESGQLRRPVKPLPKGCVGSNPTLPTIELKGDEVMLESKHYYIDLINSTKANKFTSYYHYSGVGFKKAKIN